jgi:hypothetical protein
MMANQVRSAVERLANTQMNLSLEEWQQISNTLLEAAGAIEASRREGMIDGLEMSQKYLGMAGNVRDAKSMIKAAILTAKPD